MGWHTTTSAGEFLDTAGDFLRSRPVENTVPLTVATTVRERGPHHFGPDDPVFGWFTDRTGAVTGACLQTPPFPLLVTAVPDGAMPALADLLAGRPLPGVNALTADADAFAEAWCARTGAHAEKGRQFRLFRLDGLVDDMLPHGGMTFWEVDGTPVAMAGTTRAEAGMVRVIAVYTPPERRGRGYGGAVTTTVTQAALDAGADHVVLFTDLANPTSNALYQRLGYRPVEDRSLVEFTS